jgi:hypothetical protein
VGSTFTPPTENASRSPQARSQSADQRILNPWQRGNTSFSQPLRHHVVVTNARRLIAGAAHAVPTRAGCIARTGAGPAPLVAASGLLRALAVPLARLGNTALLSATNEVRSTLRVALATGLTQTLDVAHAHVAISRHLALSAHAKDIVHEAAADLEADRCLS